MLEPSMREQVLGWGWGMLAGLGRGFWYKGVPWSLSPDQSYVKNSETQPQAYASSLVSLSPPFTIVS